MTENDRLKEIRKKLKLTQLEFSQALEIKQGSYSDVERGKAGISALLLKNLIRKYKINPLWLCEGVGEMFMNLSSDYGKNIFGKHKPKQRASAKRVKPTELHNEYIANIKEIVDFLNE
jgi:transcriptional regulator with XRE-family HTH domain